VLGQPVPESLLEPLIHDGQRLDQVDAQSRYLSPQLQADRDPTREWQGALVAHAVISSGAMQAAGRGLRALRVAYDANTLYLRVESFEELDSIHLEGWIGGEDGVRRRWERRPGWATATLDGEALATALGDHLIEMAIPFARLGVALGAQLWIQAQATHGDGAINCIPPERPLAVTLAPLA